MYIFNTVRNYRVLINPILVSATAPDGTPPTVAAPFAYLYVKSIRGVMCRLSMIGVIRESASGSPCHCDRIQPGNNQRTCCGWRPRTAWM